MSFLKKVCHSTIGKIGKEALKVGVGLAVAKFMPLAALAPKLMSKAPKIFSQLQRLMKNRGVVDSFLRTSKAIVSTLPQVMIPKLVAAGATAINKLVTDVDQLIRAKLDKALQPPPALAYLPAAVSPTPQVYASAMTSAQPNAMQAPADPEMAAILSDPKYTIEDRVYFMIALLMKQLDKQIESESQAASSQATGGTQGGGSSDIQMMKIKRLVDNRTNLFETLRGILDKFNESASKVANSISH